jgi:sec-independent protein translocase protein TatB
MFDIAFTELILIALVALVVIGPERLPGLARTAGHLLGRLQRYVGDVKADINREIQLEELKKMQQQVVESARSLESDLKQDFGSMESTLNESLSQMEPTESDAAPGVETGDTAAAPSAEATDATPQLELGFDAEQAASKKTT